MIYSRRDFSYPTKRENALKEIMTLHCQKMSMIEKMKKVFSCTENLKHVNPQFNSDFRDNHALNP